MIANDNSCDFPNCKCKGEAWVTRKCSSCFTKSVHEECCRLLAQRFPDGNYVFCSRRCFDRGPILSFDLSTLRMTCKKLSKNALKAALRSIPLSVYVPTSPGSESSKKVELRKEEMIEALMRHRIQIAQPEGAIGNKTPKKTASCDFRLVNVLFSDRFYASFSQLGNKFTREELDTGGKQSFWTEVAEEYIKEVDNEYGKLHFEHELFENIDPSYIIPHQGKKLMEMWKEIHRRYRVIHRNYKKSGNHDPDFLAAVDNGDKPDDFADFVINRPIILYTRLWLKMKPQATTYIEAPLPEVCQVDSLLEDSTLSGMGTDSQSPDDNSVVVLPQQKRRSSGSTAPENKKRHVNNTPVKINVAQSLERMSADKKERFMKKQEIAKERSGFEAEKVGILKVKTNAQMKVWEKQSIFFDVKADATSKRQTAWSLQTRLEMLGKFIEAPNTSQEARSRYQAEIESTREELLEALKVKQK